MDTTEILDNLENLVNSDSEDEIFWGAVTSLEKKKAKFLRNRKTEVFEAPLFVHGRSVSMAPHDDAKKTYSKVPRIATESERKQRIKQRPPQLPPFTQLYCTKDGESLKSPFHQLTNTKHQTKTQGHHISTKAFKDPLSSPHVLALPIQLGGRLTLSPGLSPSFYYDSFDKLLRSGHSGTSEKVSPCQYGVASSPNISCSSVEELMSPAGLLFCSPMPQKLTLSRKTIKKLQMKTTIRKGSRMVQSDQKRGQDSREPISNEESMENMQNVTTPTDINIYPQHNIDVVKTPDIFFSSSWITRRNKIPKLKRSLSVPQIHVMHPEESDTSNHRVLAEDSSDVDEMMMNNSRIPVPTWLLTMSSALKESTSSSDSLIRSVQNF